MKKTAKCFLGCGIFCALMMLASTWYAIVYNDSRLVVPMDFSQYVFRIEDLPMLFSVSISCIYIIALFLWLFCKLCHSRHETQHTVTLNPQLGWLGLLGFLGFLGFWSYPARGDFTPFAFFLFFGFFGYYYDGKMSNTFMDERFQENAMRAQLMAYKVSGTIIFIAVILLAQGKLFGSIENTLIAALIILSLALALGLFLSQYLLYRFDHDEMTDEHED